MAIALASFCLNPVPDVTEDQVDLVEINHYYDEQGRLVFDQLIYYEWCPVQCRFNVRDWRLLKSPTQKPHRDWQRGGYVATWHDAGVLRRVHADQLNESWTQYDPELVERAYLPRDKRKELTKLSKPR